MAFVVLSSHLGAAAEAKVRIDNPCRSVSPPKHQAREREALTVEQAEGFVSAFDDPDMVELMLNTGLRWSEAAGLCGDAVDWLRGFILVRRVRVRGHKDLREYGKSSTSRRWVPVDRELLTRLGKRLEGRPRDALLFPAPKGGPWDYRNWMREQWEPAVAMSRLQLPKGDATHVLRHTYTTWLADEGVDQARIQYLLGHSSPRMTRKYTHLRPEHFDGIVSALRAHQGRTSQTDDQSGNAAKGL